MINPNWSRWIFASVAVYFNAVIATNLKLPLLTEGVDDRESKKMHYNHAELRVNGPFIIEPSRNYYILSVDINVLFTELMDDHKDNAYDLFTWCGAVQTAMDGPINIYRYGSEEGDDSGWVGCLVTRRGRYDSNRVLHFGQISRVDRIRQSEVDGRFKMELYV
jgi:hypothetical protein